MKKLEKLFDILGEILAVVVVIAYAVAITNAQWNYLANLPWLINIIEIIRNYGSLLLVAIVGLEAMSKRNFILRIVFYALLALIVVFMFFPETYDNLIQMVPLK